MRQEDIIGAVIGLALFGLLIWVLSYPIVWIIICGLGVIVCAAMAVFYILTFNLLLALNWFLIGGILLVPLFIAMYIWNKQDEKKQSKTNLSENRQP